MRVKGCMVPVCTDYNYMYIVRSSKNLFCGIGGYSLCF